MGKFSGYHDCPCRDCFEIAIGERDEDDEDAADEDGKPALCSLCEAAGCDADGNEECNVSDDEDEDEDEDEDDEDEDDALAL